MNVRKWILDYTLGSNSRYFLKVKTALMKIEKFFYVFIIAALFKYKIGSVNSINDLSIELGLKSEYLKTIINICR